VIIKHLVELETVINDESDDFTAKQILAMPEDMRNTFFQVSGTAMIADLLEKVDVNKDSSWAILRVAQPR
jgi:CBS domain containing-hemolysin-like protein